jgi:hypothetical protein
VERERYENAVASYSHLRGLLLLPLGALFVVAALANEDIVPSWVFPIALVVAGAICLLIVRHYREHYGRVSPSSRQRAREAAGIVGAVATVIVVSILLGRLPVNTLAVGFALAMLAGSAVTPGLRTHHVVIWGALLVAGAVPVWDGSDSANAGLVLSGVAVALTGVFDHRAFVGTFGSPADAGA